MKRQLNAALSTSEHKHGARSPSVGENVPLIDRAPMALLIVSHVTYLTDDIDPIEGPALVRTVPNALVRAHRKRRKCTHLSGKADGLS